MRTLSANSLSCLLIALFLTTATSANAQSSLQPVVQFPKSTAVGATSDPLIVAVQLTAKGVVSGLVGVVRGTATGDFLIGSAGTCQKQMSYDIGQQCTVSVSFQPQRPGMRQGALLILGADGTLLGSILVTGVGLGPLQEITPGNITTVAGDGGLAYMGDGMAATHASFAVPLGVAVDASGNLYISDTGNNRIRRIDANSEEVSTIAGDGVSGLNGDGGPSILSEVSSPSAIALDGAGNLFFADTGNDVIRRIDRLSGLITSVVGTLGKPGYSGDGSAASSARLSAPSAFAFDASGNMVVADTGNNVIRKVDAATGVITTIAGTGTLGFNGDGALATSSLLNSPRGVAVSPQNLVYISDTNNNRVRRIDTDGTIATVAGNGIKGGSSSMEGNALALLTELDTPTAIVFDPSGRFFFSDTGNNVIREVDIVPNIGTIAGNQNLGFSGDGGIATYGRLASPVGLSYNDDGNIYVADAANNRVRELLNQQITVSYPQDTVGVAIGETYLLIENHGNANLTLQTPSFDSAQLTSNSTCVEGYVMPPAHGCSLFLNFYPVVVGDPVIGSLSWPSDALDSPSIFTLSGKVVPAEPSVTLASSLNPSVFPSAVTLTATVTSTSPSLGGLVYFLDGRNEICRATLNNSGAAACSAASLTPGQHTIIASYLGDANDNAATSLPLTQIVKGSVLVSLNAFPDPALTSNPITLVSRVSDLSDNIIPTSAITFSADGTLLGTASTGVDGSATIVVSLPAGNHSLTSTFAASAEFAASTSTPLIEVVNAQTVTILKASPNPGFQNGNESFTAMINPFATTTPSGQVTFADGSTTLGTGAVDANGHAVFSTQTLAVGTHTITATYSGATNLLPSVSAPATLLIAPQDFSLTSDPSIRIATASQANLNATLTSIGDYSDRITVTCSNMPLYASCYLSRDTPPLRAGSTLLTTIDIVTDDIPPASYVSGGSVLAFALFFPMLLTAKRRSHPPFVRASLGAFALLLADVLSGCSGHYPSHTPPGTYNIALTAVGVSSALTHTANVVLVVTP